MSKVLCSALLKGPCYTTYLTFQVQCTVLDEPRQTLFHWSEVVSYYISNNVCLIKNKTEL